MLEVSTLRSPSKADQHAGFPTSDCGEDDCFMVDENLLDYIDFTCCDVVPSFFDADGDILPDLEVDPTELLAEFEDQPATVASPACRSHHHGSAAEMRTPDDKKEESPGGVEEKKVRKNGGDNEVLSAVATRDSAAAAAGSSDTKSSASAEGQSKKTKPSNKNSHGNKKKGKVEWTPELHRRFVRAVEQLGIDKAVPSRILEIMGIECLTRHNIASHLQKYRSHRKHLMAREAEAATWAQKRQMYAAAASGGQVAGAPRTTKDMPAAAGRPWVVPTMGFPPPPFGRPLHVWGHPPTAVEAAAPPMWPRHLALPRPWAPVVDPAAYWHHHHQQQQYSVPRFPAPGMMPPHPMYRPLPPRPPQTAGSKLAGLQLQLDAHPSKESIDAAIGDVLVKPWLPLPLGLKPPSLDSVMSELHKQGIPKIPPAATSSS